MTGNQGNQDKDYYFTHKNPKYGLVVSVNLTKSEEVKLNNVNGMAFRSRAEWAELAERDKKD